MSTNQIQNEKSLQIFENPEFGQVRIIEVEGKPYVVAIDVAKGLEYSLPHKAVRDHCRGVLTWNIPTKSGNQDMLIIPEGDIYRLIVKAASQSRNKAIKEKAERFEHWVFDEVLPTIRRHGMYLTEKVAHEAIENVELFLSRALLIAKDKIDVLQIQLDDAAPKVLLADSITASGTSIPVGDMAKILRQHGIEIGQNRLYEWLRENDYLMKTGKSRNLPTQKAMELELFEIEETAYCYGNTLASINRVARVTGKGQLYFVNLFRKKSA